MIAYKESLRRWWRLPFTTKPPEGKRRGRAVEAHACKFCGSVAILGADRLLLLKQREKDNGELRHFCDLECAAEFKKLHNKTIQYRTRYMQTALSEGRSKQQQLNRLRLRQKRIQQAQNQAAQDRLARRKLLKSLHKGWWCCIECGSAYNVQRKARCSQCTRKANAVSKQCVRCGIAFETHLKSQIFCSNDCAITHHKKQAKHRRRVRIANAPHESISIVKLCEMHNWKCCNCNTKCTLPTGDNDEREATIDHVIPVAKGGLHLWSNVQMLCRRCNTLKSDDLPTGMQSPLSVLAITPRGVVSHFEAHP